MEIFPSMQRSHTSAKTRFQFLALKSNVFLRSDFYFEGLDTFLLLLKDLCVSQLFPVGGLRAEEHVLYLWCDGGSSDCSSGALNWSNSSCSGRISAPTGDWNNSVLLFWRTSCLQKKVGAKWKHYFTSDSGAEKGSQMFLLPIFLGKSK